MTITSRNVLIAPKSSLITRFGDSWSRARVRNYRILLSIVVYKKKTALWTHCLVTYKENYYNKQILPSF